MDVNSELKQAQLEVLDSDPAHSVYKKGLVWFNRQDNRIRAFFNSTIKTLVTQDQLDSTNADVAAIPPILTKVTSVSKPSISDFNGDRLSWTVVPDTQIVITHAGGPIHLSTLSTIEVPNQVGDTMPLNQFEPNNFPSAFMFSVGYFVNDVLVDSTSISGNSSVNTWHGRGNIRPTSLIKPAGTYTINIRFKMSASKFGANNGFVRFQRFVTQAIYT